ncbi:MAG: hypothetical protein NTW95_14685 [Candidatus Aminicenantes bacterium]|nr:hypothetical protein [Candidatus Aminicenantes bacterium]
MKNILIFAVFLLLLAAPSYSQDESMAKGKAILEKAVHAMGGSDKIKAIKTVIQKGDWIVTGTTSSLERITTFPDKCSRQTVISPGDKVVVEIKNGTGTITNSKGSAPLGDDATKDFLRTILRDPIYLWQNLGQYQVHYAGDKIFAGHDTHELLISGLSICRYFIDKESFQIIGCQYTIVYPGGSSLIEEQYSDFRAVAGVTFSFKTVQLGDGKIQIKKNFRGIKWE